MCKTPPVGWVQRCKTPPCRPRKPGWGNMGCVGCGGVGWGGRYLNNAPPQVLSPQVGTGGNKTINVMVAEYQRRAHHHHPSFNHPTPTNNIEHQRNKCLAQHARWQKPAMEYAREEAHHLLTIITNIIRSSSHYTALASPGSG